VGKGDQSPKGCEGEFLLESCQDQIMKSLLYCVSGPGSSPPKIQEEGTVYGSQNFLRLGWRVRA
jgi:hypothetical protein